MTVDANRRKRSIPGFGCGRVVVTERGIWRRRNYASEQLLFPRSLIAPRKKCYTIHGVPRCTKAKLRSTSVLTVECRRWRHTLSRRGDLASLANPTMATSQGLNVELEERSQGSFLSPHPRSEEGYGLLHVPRRAASISRGSVAPWKKRLT